MCIRDRLLRACLFSIATNSYLHIPVSYTHLDVYKRQIPPAGIALLSIMMILGRLEIYTVLVLLLPAARMFVRRA